MIISHSLQFVINLGGKESFDDDRVEHLLALHLHHMIEEQLRYFGLVTNVCKFEKDNF